MVAKAADIYGFKTCECGCGGKVAFGKRFQHGHWAKTMKGKEVLLSYRFKDARTEHGDGYRTVLQKGIGHVLEHRAIAGVVGTKKIVHHVDGNRDNNSPENLKIFSSNAEHAAEHRRQRALDECGHANWRKCAFCGQYDDPSNLYIPPNNKGTVEHRACGRKYRANRLIAKEVANHG